MPTFSSLEPSAPIALFDSGVGGLTVARALRALMPGENLVYFGDTARVPYGIKSAQAIIGFARQNANFLMKFKPKMLVVACNTASAVAGDDLRESLPVPVVGVIKAGARAAVQATTTFRVGVIGTEATVSTHVYRKSIQEINPAVTVYEKACPLFVPLVEEGRNVDEPLVYSIVKEYLRELFDKNVDCLVLGCTHYPLLTRAISKVMGGKVALVDSALETATAVKEQLAAAGLLNPAAAGSDRFIVSDHPARFQAISAAFLGRAPGQVESVDIGQFYTRA